MNKPDITIIIPFFNEEENVPTLVRELNEFIKSDTENIYEVIFVDDGSIDNSLTLLTKQNISFQFKIIKLSKNFGSHAAIRAGYKFASGENIVNIYADLQEPLHMILKMNTKLAEGYDIVWAFRKTINTTLIDRLFSRAHGYLIKKYVNRDYPDSGLDFVMFNKKIQHEINKNVEANSSFALQIFNMGYKQAYIEYIKEPRLKGESKWTFSKKFKILVDSLVSFSYFPIRLVSVIGILFFIIGLFWTIYIISRKTLYNDLELGWASLLSILMIGFGVTNVSLGIIAEYLWRTFDVARNRPVFIVEEIIDPNSHLVFKPNNET